MHEQLAFRPFNDECTLSYPCLFLEFSIYTWLCMQNSFINAWVFFYLIRFGCCCCCCYCSLDSVESISSVEIYCLYDLITLRDETQCFLVMCARWWNVGNVNVAFGDISMCLFQPIFSQKCFCWLPSQEPRIICPNYRLIPKLSQC